VSFPSFLLFLSPCIPYLPLLYPLLFLLPGPGGTLRLSPRTHFLPTVGRTSFLAYEFYFDCSASAMWSCELAALLCALVPASAYNLLAFLCMYYHYSYYYYYRYYSHSHNLFIILHTLFNTHLCYIFGTLVLISVLATLSHVHLRVAPSFSASRRSVNINVILLSLILWGIYPLLSRDSVTSDRCYISPAIIEKLCFLYSELRMLLRNNAANTQATIKDVFSMWSVPGCCKQGSGQLRD
jgi:hypothetical protein